MTEKMLLLDTISDSSMIPPWTVLELERDSLSDAVHSAIECRCFDAVDVLIAGCPYVLLVDDDGLLRPDWKPCLPAWYWYSQFNENAPIAGKVLVCKEGFDSDGVADIVGLDDFDLTLLSQELESLKKLTGEF